MGLIMLYVLGSGPVMVLPHDRNRLLIKLYTPYFRLVNGSRGTLMDRLTQPYYAVWYRVMYGLWPADMVTPRKRKELRIPPP